MAICRFAQEVSQSQTAFDPREVAAYPLSQAARYLQVPRSTLRAWVLGRSYVTVSGKVFFQPILQLPEPGRPVLSFFNLVEAHVLNAIRRHHKLPLSKVRRAIRYLEKEFPSKHPLAEHSFETDGVDLFLEKYGQLIAISANGQLALRGLLEDHLERIERDPAGVPIRLYPFTRGGKRNDPRLVVVDPFVSLGQAVIAGTTTSTGSVAARYKQGESIIHLAASLARSPAEIEEAIRLELQPEMAG